MCDDGGVCVYVYACVCVCVRVCVYVPSIVFIDLRIDLRIFISCIFMGVVILLWLELTLKHLL